MHIAPNALCPCLLTTFRYLRAQALQNPHRALRGQGRQSHTSPGPRNKPIPCVSRRWHSQAKLTVGASTPETLLRAIPFSLNVLWRLAIVFPFMILALCVFGFIAAIFTVLVMFVSHLVGFLMVVAFGVAAGVLPVIVGARMALQARRAPLRTSYFGLMLPAIGYGLFEAFCVMLIIAAGAVAYLVATPLTFDDFGRFATMDQEMLVEQLLSVSPAVSLSILWVGGVLMIGLRAALLMPFAGASIGMDPGGRPHTPFYGFGSEFISLLILVAIGYILSTLAVPIALALCYLLGFGETLTVALAQLEATPSLNALQLMGKEAWIFFGICLLIYLWAFSLQSAGGALAYINQLQEVADQQNAFDMSMDAHLESMSNPQPVERPIQSEDVM